MSERAVATFFAVIIAIIAFCVGAATGTYNGHLLGVIQGRAEMKRWQDSYYAAHPVRQKFTLETTSHSVECIVKDSTHLLCDERMFEKLAVPSPAPKPPKASKRQPMPYEWSNDGHRHTIEELNHLSGPKACGMSRNGLGGSEIVWAARADGGCYKEDAPQTFR